MHENIRRLNSALARQEAGSTSTWRGSSVANNKNFYDANGEGYRRLLGGANFYDANASKEDFSTAPLTPLLRYQMVFLWDASRILSDLPWSQPVMITHFARQFARVFADNNPEANYRVFLVNVPWAFRVLWSTVALWLDKETGAKVKMLGADWVSTLMEEGVLDEAGPGVSCEAEVE